MRGGSCGLMDSCWCSGLTWETETELELSGRATDEGDKLEPVAAVSAGELLLTEVPPCWAC